MKKELLQGLLVNVIALVINQFRDNLHDFFAGVGDALNDKIEKTSTEADDIVKQTFVDALQEAFIPELQVDGVDGPVAAQPTA